MNSEPYQIGIKHLLTIKTDPALLYQALITAEGLSAWWAPAVEARTDQTKFFIFSFSNGYFKKIEVISESDNHVRWSCTEATPEWMGTIITFDILKSKNGGCTLLFSHDHWKSYSSMFYQCSFDWAMFLRSLKRLLENGMGSPYPRHHE